MVSKTRNESGSPAISRSEQKRRLKQVEAAARELVQLGDADLRKLDIEESLKQAVSLCRSSKGGALKRQLKFVAKLLRNEDLDKILQFLSRRLGSELEEKRFFHEAEQLRDTVISEAIDTLAGCRQRQEPWPLNWQSAAIEQVLHSYPDIDEQELRQVVHQFARSRNKVYYRETFRIIYAAAQNKRRQQGKDGQ